MIKDTTIPIYGSAEDLPKFKNMLEQLAALEALAPMPGDDKKSIENQVKDLRRQVEMITRTVDRFYSVLGSRKWVFHERLPLDEVKQLLDESSDPEAAQLRLLAIYSDQERLRGWVHGSWLRDDLYPRQRLLGRALDQFRREEFDSCALTLITVMDGYVQDIDGRFGLHAKNPDDMTAWDSVVGHHLGLTHVLKTHRTQIKRRRDEEVFELYRHGIVHGLVMNYDNRVVATKAWNMLLSLVDWADAKDRVRADQVAYTSQTLSDVIAKSQESQRRIARMRAWEKRVIARGDSEFAMHEAVRLTDEFMSAWQKQNYGRIAQLAHRVWYRGQPDGKVAGEMRRKFEAYRLEGYEIREVDGTTNNVWETRGVVRVNGSAAHFAYRWAIELPNQWTGGPGDEGPRKLVNCEPVRLE